jgi:Tol biopolymer transport system component
MSSRPVRLVLARWLAPGFLLAVSACSGSDCPFDPLDPGCAAHVEAAAPPRALVFQSTRDAPFEVYTANADGTDVVRLTTTGRNGQPRWSPDGTRIAFTSWRAGRAEIWVMNADGSAQARVVALDGAAYMPDWSPDGARLAFSVERGDGNFDIHIVNADGTGLQRITATQSWFGPRWSPDGSRLAARWFESSADCPCVATLPQCPCNGRIALLNPDGTGVQLLPRVGECDAWPEWSPDGRHIAFSSYRSRGPGFAARGELMLMSAAGANPRALTAPVLIDDFSPAWSRSTGHIYFVRTTEIYSVRPDGSNEVRISAVQANDMAVHAR